MSNTQLVNINMAGLTVTGDAIVAAMAMMRAGVVSLAGGTNRIGLKGGRFNISANGMEFTHPAHTLDCIFLGATEVNHRTWYAKAFAPDQDNDVPPTCFSSNGETPDEGIPASNRQGVNCASCPKNQEHSGANGIGKACATSRRIVVCLPRGTQGAGVLLQIKVGGLSLFGDDYPKMNLLNFKNYARQLFTMQETQRVPAFAFLTQLAFDANQSVPVLRFSCLDLANRGTQPRQVTPEDLEFAVMQIGSGEVKKLLDAPAATVEKAASAPESAPRPSFVPPADPTAYNPPPVMMAPQPQAAPPLFVPQPQAAPVAPAPTGVVRNVAADVADSDIAGFPRDL